MCQSVGSTTTLGCDPSDGFAAVGPGPRMSAVGRYAVDAEVILRWVRFKSVLTLCKAIHSAESLLPGGRGALLVANVAMPPRVWWVKDPVGLNRRSDVGALWVLNWSADARLAPALAAVDATCSNLPSLWSSSGAELNAGRAR